MESIYDEHYLYNHDDTIRPLLVTITSKDFMVFIEGETTREEVERTVGKAHAYFGSGNIRNVYLTADKHLISITYISQDEIIHALTDRSIETSE